MKIAVVYNRASKNVINLFGIPNRETYGKKSIKTITDSLKKGGHQVKTFEGDKDLISNLEEFMPKVIAGERPGLVFNLSYGIQGQARYTHVPGILEMIGIPYSGSGPLAHSIALDKVVAKVVFKQHGVPTPEFAVVNTEEFDIPDIPFPMIVKPASESTSMGIAVVNNEDELRTGVLNILRKFDKTVLIEQFISGREINVGILGNDPPEALPIVELKFGRGPKIYSYEDKLGKSGRTVEPVCPARIDKKTRELASELAIKAFKAIGCNDFCRVDFRMDKEGNLYVLEINSLASLGPRGSYVKAAGVAGYDYVGLVNKMVDVAVARYFGTEIHTNVGTDPASPSTKIFDFLVRSRDKYESSLQDWVSKPSFTFDPVGIRRGIDLLDKKLTDIGMKQSDEFTNDSSCWTWQSEKGLKNGTLIINHIDIPGTRETPRLGFRKTATKLYGEGIGASRAPIVTMLWALRALRSQKKLRNLPLAVLCYSDEGRDCRYSSETIIRAASSASRVIVMRPGNPVKSIITQRRGQRKYSLEIEGRVIRPGAATRKPDPLAWTCQMVDKLGGLTNRKERISVSATEIESRSYPSMLPNSVTANLIVSYPNSKTIEKIDGQMRKILDKSKQPYTLSIISDRPAYSSNRANKSLAKSLKNVAEKWEIDIDTDSSLLPSVAGLIPGKIPVVCGMGPAAHDLYTPNEHIDRYSLIQRILLLSQFLLETGDAN